MNLENSKQEEGEPQLNYLGEWNQDLTMSKPKGFKSTKISSGVFPIKFQKHRVKKSRRAREHEAKPSKKITPSVQDHTHRVFQPEVEYRRLDCPGSDSDQDIESEESSDDEKDEETRKQREIFEGRLYDMSILWRLTKIYKKNGKLNISMVAEKPKVAKTLFDILSEQGSYHYTERYKGHTVYQFQGEYKGMAADFNILSVYGHIYNHGFQNEAELKSEKNPMEIFEAKIVNNHPARKNFATTRRRGPNKMKFLLEYLCCYMDESDMIVLWLDNDFSGENICFQIIRMLEQYRFKKNDPHSKTRYIPENIMRAKFSSLSRREIFRTFNNLKTHPNERKAYAHDLRSEVDLRLGRSFTVLLSNEIRNYLKIGREFITSYGPCQFPTFWFVYQRYRSLEDTPAEPYWLPVITIETEDGDELDLELSGKKFSSQEEATEFLTKLAPIEELEASSVSTKTEYLEKPKPMNTVDLLSSACEEFGFSASKTRAHAQNLYTRGLISYPRTHSRAYAYDYQEDKVLEMFQKKNEFKEIASELRSHNNIVKLQRGAKEDHPPISPVHLVSQYRKLKKDTAISKLYHHIVSHFFASMSQDCTLQTVNSEFRLSELTFVANFSNIMIGGYLEHLPLTEKLMRILNISEARIERGNSYKVKGFKIQRRFPATKELLSEPELIKKMEKHRIGTDGTIPSHINIVIKRGYVTIEKGKDGVRRFKPTKKGIALAEGFKELDKDLFEPTVRRYIEYQWKKVAKGRTAFASAREDALAMFKTKLEKFIGSIEVLQKKMDLYKEDIVQECEELVEKQQEARQGIQASQRLVGRGLSFGHNGSNDESNYLRDMFNPSQEVEGKTSEVSSKVLHKLTPNLRRGYEYLLYEEEIQI
ncbi:unnamed protein product [Moneuplotes crassus]|uniref:DNA topoisomerase n=1 Tax=Euplotes crassus TaxID=5936 RepID=A0AAD1Y236_EUPCR|nr:unnamed protein product [Moneuplotes crassus]